MNASRKTYGLNDICIFCDTLNTSLRKNIVYMNFHVRIHSVEKIRLDFEVVELKHLLDLGGWKGMER